MPNFQFFNPQIPYIWVFFACRKFCEKRVNLYIFLFYGSYFLRFKTIYRAFLWHTITNIISTCFIFRELKMVAKNAKIRLPRKKTDIRYSYLHARSNIPIPPVYGVYKLKLIRYARSCSTHMFEAVY
jgi:hypothetical protein